MTPALRSPCITLASLKPSPGSQHSQRRVGRGQGSGYGGTAGRGANGQKSRSGPGPRPGFEGGQTPITKLFPKRGFTNQSAKLWAPVNLERVQHWIDQGRLSSSLHHPITARELLRSGCVHDVHDGIKILGDGAEQLRKPIFIIASRASRKAIHAIEENGGKVICQYHNKVSLQKCVKGHRQQIDAAPTRRTDIVWYGQHHNRGYLSPAVLTSIGHLPWVDGRWKTLSRQLGAWRTQ